jgi:hypothetical protein
VVETAVNSFVLRFVQEAAAPGGGTDAPSVETAAEWHGVIRHVQSNAELRFVQMDEALAFIATFVPMPPAPAPNSRPAADLS